MMIEWEPISERHKDGRRWLLWAPKYGVIVTARWNPEQAWRYEKGAWAVPCSMLMDPADFTLAAPFVEPTAEATIRKQTLRLEARGA